MKTRYRLLAVFLAFSTAFTPVVGGIASAATSSGDGNGMEVSPLRTDITMDPGTTKTVTVNVKNVTKSPETLQVIINDFVANRNEFGVPSLLLDKNDFAPTHSLKRYAAPVPNLTLEPTEQKAVKITITLPKNAPGGGYFGAVRFAPVSAGDNTKSVSLAASVGSLILVRASGNVKEQVSLASFAVEKKPSGPQEEGTTSSFYTNGKNIQAVARFQNEGDVQEAPFGKVVLRKGSTILETKEINTNSPKNLVLPDSIRRFSVDLDKVDGFGKYTVEGNFGYGTNGQLVAAKTTFYVLPVGLIAVGVFVIILILLLLIVLPRWMRNHDRAVLRKAGRR